MTTRHATCSCGRLRASTEGEPVRISICHCLACQQRTGSVFGVQARFPADAVHVEGDSTEYVRSSDDGGKVRLHFCPKCASTVWYELEQVPGFIAIPVGAFADPGFPAPRISVYEERMHPWVGINADVEHLD